VTILPAHARTGLQPRTIYKDIGIRFMARNHSVGDKTGTSVQRVLLHRTVQGPNSGLDGTTIRRTSVESTPIGSRKSCSDSKHVAMNLRGHRLTVRRSESLRPEDALTESGYASAPSQTDPLEQSHQQDTSSPMGPGLPSQVHQPGDFPLFNLGQNSGMDELAGVGQGPLADPSMGHREPDIGLHVPNNSSGYGLSVLSDAAATMGSHQSPKDSVMPTPDTPFGAIPSVRVSQYRFGADQNHGLAQMQWPEGPSGSPKRKMSHDGREGEHSGHPDGDFECEVCGKRKKRDCDRR